MKRLTSLFTTATLFTATASAHDDPVLHPTFHEFYHVIFYSLLAAIVVCAGIWGIKQLSKHKN